METAHEFSHIPEYFLIKPHFASVGSRAVHELNGLLSRKGPRALSQAVDEILVGQKPGGFCSCCGMSFQDIIELHKKAPYRFVCLPRGLMIRHIETEWGKLLPLTSLGIGLDIKLP